MSPQETQMLQNFLDQLVQVKGTVKDPQAQTMIQDAYARQPDAAYLLVQKTLLMEQALSNANRQIADLQAELRELRSQPAAAAGNSQSGFLNSASGGWGNSAPARSLNTAAVPAQVMQAAPAQPVPQQAPAAGGFFSNNSGMLGNIASTAAGVAAGAFLYQGISHMFGSHNSGNHNALSDQSGAAQLNNSQGEFIPGYFSQPQNDSSPLEPLDAPLSSDFASDDSYGGDDLI